MKAQALKEKKTHHFTDKIKTLDELEKIVARMKQNGERVVLCHGVFDLLHPGHLHHFDAAKKKGDRLVVTITKDSHVGKGPGRPVFNQRLRAETVAAFECVDYVAINEWPTAVETIKKLKPDFYAKGSDYAQFDDDLTGMIRLEESAVREVGGQLILTNEVSFSSSSILNTYFSNLPEETQAFLKSFRERYPSDIVIKKLNNLKKLKVLVVGDAIIDEYHYCVAMGKSPKETIVATRYVSEESFAGGALACANHVAGFCEQVDLVTCLGAQNSREDFIRKHLKPNVRPKFFYRDDATTVIKRRFVEPAFLSKMFQICFLNDTELPSNVSGELQKYLEGTLPHYDAVLVADYGHGLLNREAIDALASKARFLAVNTQTNSANIGFNLVTKYPKVDYVCVDEPEIRLAAQNRSGLLEDLILLVGKKLKSSKITVTRGHNGAIVYSEEQGFTRIPIFSSEIVDRVGAGDAFFAITSPCAASDFPTDLIGFIGNMVGALAVKIVCNRSFIEPLPLARFITAILK